jgi:hypothetical protein
VRAGEGGGPPHPTHIVVAPPLPQRKLAGRGRGGGERRLVKLQELVPTSKLEEEALLCTLHGGFLAVLQLTLLCVC